MRLDELRLKGVRHFPDGCVVKFRPDMTVLVGPNGSGKSSILDAVQFLLEGKASGELGRGDNEPTLEVSGVFTDDDDRGVIVRAIRDPRGRRTLEMLEKTSPLLPSGLPGATVGELRTFLGRRAPARARKLELQATAAKVLAALDDTNLEQRWVTLPEDVEKRLPRFTRLDAESMIDVKRAIDEVLGREFRGFIERNQEEWAEWNRRFVDESQSAIAAIYANVTRQCGDVLDELLVEAFINTEKVKIDTTLTAVRAGQAIITDDLSLGQRRRLALAVGDALTERLGTSGSEFLAYDEPDTHLDNASQRRLLRLLREQSEVSGVQIAVATHSTALINDCEPTRLVHLLLTEAGIPHVRIFADLVSHEEEPDLMRELDISLDNSRLLADRLIVVCEGQSEERALASLYRRCYGRSLRSDGILLVHKDGSNDAIRFAQMLERIRPDSVLLVLDNDQRERAKDQLRGSNVTLLTVGDTRT